MQFLRCVSGGLSCFDYGAQFDLSEATEQYFPVVLFIMLYKVVLNFESVVKS